MARDATIFDQLVNGQQLLGPLMLGPLMTLLFGVLVSLVVQQKSKAKCDDDLATFNRLFPWEPSYFARLRWITNAQRIIDDADRQVRPYVHSSAFLSLPSRGAHVNSQAQGRPYRLARGDTDQIILPPSMIPELNHLGADVLNSRESHAFGLLGDLTGLGVVRKTSFHVRVLLSYISPALPSLFTLSGERISSGIENEFPQTSGWTVIKPSKAIVRCISEAIVLVLFGADMTAKNPELVHLAHSHTNNGRYHTFSFTPGPKNSGLMLPKL
jgi:hypothetical protein